MDRWDNLNMQQKAQLLGIYASKGYTDLASIISHYNAFQAGGIVSKVTPQGQWEYPGEITTIPSNNITMKGVDYPVIGVSNTGDTKYMLPNMDYLFDGQYVTEYPINHKFQIGGVAQTQLELKNRRQVKDRKEGKFPSLMDLLNGYLNNPEGTYMTDNYTEDQLQEFRKRAYANYMPYYTGFSGILKFKKAVDNLNTNPDKRNIYAGSGEHDINLLDDLYATYMNIPLEERRFPSTRGTYLTPTEFRPNSGSSYNNVYKLNSEALPELNKDIINLYYLAEKNDWRKSKNHIVPGDTVFEERGGSPIDWSVLGDFIVSRGFDPKKGEYISLYDDWDLNPIKGKSSEFKWLQDNKHGDLTQGLGKPYSIYNRVYLDDYYGMSSKPTEPDTYYGGWLPEIDVTAEKR